MMTKLHSASACLAWALLSAAGGVSAQTVRYADQATDDRPVWDRPVRGFVAVGLTGGGDRVARAEYTDGSEYTLRGGGSFQLQGGAEFRLSDRFALAVSGGYHADSAGARNGSISFRRFPVETLGHAYLSRHWRIGGGLRVAFNPRLVGDRVADYVDARFRTAYSPVFEVEYRFNPNMGLKGRAVVEHYRSRSFGQPSVNGNHAGLIFSYYF